jgi:hypothetical protein
LYVGDLSRGYSVIQSGHSGDGEGGGSRRGGELGELRPEDVAGMTLNIVKATPRSLLERRTPGIDDEGGAGGGERGQYVHK